MGLTLIMDEQAAAVKLRAEVLGGKRRANPSLRLVEDQAGVVE